MVVFPICNVTFRVIMSPFCQLNSPVSGTVMVICDKRKFALVSLRSASATLTIDTDSEADCPLIPPSMRLREFTSRDTPDPRTRVPPYISSSSRETLASKVMVLADELA